MHHALTFLILILDGIFGFTLPFAVRYERSSSLLLANQQKPHRIEDWRVIAMSTSNSVPAEASRQSTGVEVVVVGSCNTDLMTYTPRLPSRGKLKVAHVYFLTSSSTCSNVSMRPAAHTRFAEKRLNASKPSSEEHPLGRTEKMTTYTVCPHSRGKIVRILRCRALMVHRRSARLVGETITGSRFETLYGGKGANQVRHSYWARIGPLSRSCCCTL